VLCPAALSIREFLAKHSIPVVPHLPYLPGLALCNFLPQAKITLKGKRFQLTAQIKLTTWQVQAIPE